MRLRGLVTLAVTCGMLFAGTPASAALPGDEVRDRLESVPGLTVVGERPTEPGFRLFDLTFEQPTDHRHPGAGRFQQRLTLLHRGSDRPTVAYTSGYNLPAKVTRAEPTQLIDGNQLNIEHRFFTPSRPDPADWSKLDIWQSATDEHRIIEGLKRAYGEEWITTGGSKGGMTAVYHRRFYPKDVDGTVAYVAPNDVDNDDDRYDEFLANVGTDPACRNALTALQREALTRRGELLQKFGAFAQKEGLTFDRIIGNIDRALESVVVDAPFAFWQYQGQQDCGKIPATTASTDQIYAFLDQTVEWRFYTDQGLEPYVPYYYQAGTQLGWPYVSDEALADLLHNRELGNPRGLVPRDIPMRFQRFVMRDVDAWVRQSGEGLMFVNGSNDPWSAEPFELGPGSKDSHSYLVPGGNHGSKISGLAGSEQDAATVTLRRWAGVDHETHVLNTIRVPALDQLVLERRPR